MRTKIIGCLIGLSALMVAGARAQAVKPGQSFPLPEGTPKPAQMVICGKGDSILFASPKEGEAREWIYSIFNLSKGTAKEILTSGPGSMAASPEGHLYALITRTASRYELIIVDDEGTLGGIERSDQRLWDPQFSSNGSEVLMRSDAPGVAPPSNPNEFNAFAVYNVYDQKFTSTLVNPPGLALRRTAGSMGTYVFPAGDAKAGAAGVRVFDANGNISTVRAAARGVNLSATGFYYLSPQTEVRGPFALYEAATHRLLREYNRGGKSGEGITVLRWHPRNDKWLAIWRDAPDGSRTLEVLDAESGKTVRSIYRWNPAETSLPWAWAPDGSAVVIFHSGKFRFEPIK